MQSSPCKRCDDDGWELKIRFGLQDANFHDDVIKWKGFPRYWSFVRGIHRSPVNTPHKGQWRGDLMFSLICAWINDWVNTHEAGDLRCHRAHYDVTVVRKFWCWNPNITGNNSSYLHKINCKNCWDQWSWPKSAFLSIKAGVACQPNCNYIIKPGSLQQYLFTTRIMKKMIGCDFSQHGTYTYTHTLAKSQHENIFYCCSGCIIYMCVYVCASLCEGVHAVRKVISEHLPEFEIFAKHYINSIRREEEYSILLGIRSMK